MSKRNYTRRSEEERIEELQQKIVELKQRMESKQRKDTPVLREMKKVKRVLKSFAATAFENARPDVGNMVEAFCAGLERNVGMEPAEPRRRGRASGEADGDA